MNIFFVVALFLLVLFIFKRNSAPGGKYVSSLKVKWFLRAYGILLLLATILFFLHPTVNADYQNNGDSPGLGKVVENPSQIYDAALEGRIDQEEAVYKKNQWSFELSDNQMHISFNGFEYEYFLVAEKTSEHDGQVEVIHYATRSVFNDIDITDQIPSPEVQMDGNMIKISNSQTHLEFSKMNNEFSITQFKGGSSFGLNYQTVSNMGHNVLYIKVPSDVEIVYNGDIQYVRQDD
jgi:hypothetical protein